MSAKFEVIYINYENSRADLVARYFRPPPPTLLLGTPKKAAWDMVNLFATSKSLDIIFSPSTGVISFLKLPLLEKNDLIYFQNFLLSVTFLKLRLE